MGFWLATLATPPCLGVRKREKFCLTMTKTVFGQDEAWTNVELHVWPVPAQVKNSKISPYFPPNLPQIHQKDLNLSKKFDENSSNWWKWGRFGGSSLLPGAWGCMGAPQTVPQPCPAIPSQGAPPIYVWCAISSFVEKGVNFPCRHKVPKMWPRGWIFPRFFAGMLGT